MLGWSLIFLLVALVSAVFGFTGLAGASAAMAKVVFLVAIMLWLITAASTFVQGQKSYRM